MATKVKEGVGSALREMPSAIPPVLGGLIGLSAGAALAGLMGRIAPPAAKYAEPIGSGVVVLLGVGLAAQTRGILREFAIGMAVGAFLDLLLEIGRIFYAPIGQLPWPGF